MGNKKKECGDARDEEIMALRQANLDLQQELAEQRRADARLTRELAQAQLTLRVIPSAALSLDLKGKITSWNNKAERVTGYRREEVLDHSCEIFALGPCAQECADFVDDQGQPLIGRVCQIKTRDGKVRSVAKNTDLLKDLDGTVTGAVVTFKDITEQLEVELQLRTERDKFRGIFSALDQGMHILNRDYVIEYQNEILRRIFGDKIGEKCYEVYKQRDRPCEVCRMHAAIERNEIQRTEEIMSDRRHYEQSYVPFADVDGQTKALILLRDVTEEKMYRAETMRAG